jgi:hypothetical protein
MDETVDRHQEDEHANGKMLVCLEHFFNIAGKESKATGGEAHDGAFLRVICLRGVIQSNRV